MNKKSKRITLGLVSALCLLLVVALGFGVTGAWYRARRQATGVVKLDQGIELRVKQLYGAEKANATSTGPNFLYELNAGGTDITSLANGVSVVPGTVINVAVPAIAKNLNTATSTDFYAKAKLIYTFGLKATLDNSAIAGTFTLDQLYTDDEETPLTTGDLFKVNKELAWNTTNWKHFGNQDGVYFYVSSDSATAPSVVPYVAADQNSEIKLFTSDAQNTITPAIVAASNADGVPFKAVEFKDWTEPLPAELALGDGTGYVEFGGPVVYYNSGTAQDPVYSTAYIETLNITVIIDVIQSTNVGTYNAAHDASPTNALETWVNAAVSAS